MSIRNNVMRVTPFKVHRTRKGLAKVEENRREKIKVHNNVTDPLIKSF